MSHLPWFHDSIPSKHSLFLVKYTVVTKPSAPPSLVILAHKVDVPAIDNKRAEKRFSCVSCQFSFRFKSQNKNGMQFSGQWHIWQLRMRIQKKEPIWWLFHEDLARIEPSRKDRLISCLNRYRREIANPFLSGKYCHEALFGRGYRLGD